MEPQPSTTARTQPGAWRWLFWAYWLVLTIALLWPNLTAPEVIPRPDLVVHGVAFGLFSLLLCIWNPAGSARRVHVATLAFVAGIAYGGATELLQSIPALKRSAAWDDWGADVFGVVCGLVVYALIRPGPRAR
ncbi:MAG: VanZ family protein [Phycisphaerales bacterium]|nr:VanZ family protein [Phycisphaerales bacterium]